MNVSRSGIAFVLALALSVSASAQLNTGEVGVSGFSTVQFSVVDPTAGTATPYGNLNFGGSGTSQSILWDPQNPNSFLVGGFGFVGRATVTGAGTATYSLITTSVGTAAQMSFDSAGQIVVADAGTDQMVSVDPGTGIVTPLTAGPQPWGTAVNAGCVDPTTGTLYVGANGAIYQVNAGVVTPVANNWGGGYVSGIIMDPQGAGIVATILSVHRMVRIDAAGNLTDLYTPGSVSSANSLAVDENGDFIVGGAQGSVYRVPYAGGAPTLVGQATGQGSSASGVSVVGGGVGPIPFTMTVALTTSTVVFQITGIPSGTVEGWTAFTGLAPTAVGGGPVFGITPDALTLLLPTLVPVAQPGDLIHWVGGVPGVYPDAPYSLPLGAVAGFSGQIWDFVAIAVGPSGLSASSVARVLWP